MESETTFRKWLADGLTSARYSIRELADEIRMSHSFVANLLSAEKPVEDRVKRVDRSVVENIARVLKIDKDEGLRLAGWPAGAQELERIPVSPGTATIHHNIERLANNLEALRILEAAAKTFLREQGYNPDAEEDGGSTIGRKAE